jgi:indolepyruvate ferredoxin oxidoreductase beta subunit
VRPLRPRTLRFGREQDAIDRWIAQALHAAASDTEHGSESFAKLMTAAQTLNTTTDAAPRLADQRAAALLDEDGTALDHKLTTLTWPRSARSTRSPRQRPFAAATPACA